MKKIKLVILGFLAVVVCFCFGGCGVHLEDEVKNNLSDMRYNLFDAKTEDLKVNLMCGVREEPYAYDGISNKKCDFGVITVIFIKPIQHEKIKFKLEVDNKTYTGELERNPRNGSYMADIEYILSDNANVNLSLDGFQNDIQLTCKSKNWNVQYSEALTLGMNQLSEEIEDFFVKKKFKAEAYLKIIYDEKAVLDSYFWYFGILGENGTNVCVIIDTEGNIIKS